MKSVKREIRLHPIGIIHAPYKEPAGMPIQGRFGERHVRGEAEVFPEYAQGLKDLDGFSHATLVYYFHRSGKETLVGRPFLENKDHGIFAIRSPHRPNHLGVTTVKLEKISGNIITFSQGDMLDGTPLLDIKPYVSHFDRQETIRNGWLEKHFSSGTIPRRTRL